MRRYDAGGYPESHYNRWVTALAGDATLDDPASEGTQQPANSGMEEPELVGQRYNIQLLPYKKAEGGSDMTVEENKELVRRYIEEGVVKVAQGDVAAIHEFLADDFMNHTPLLHDPHAKGKEHMVTNIQEGGNALPDLDMTADIILAEGDLVAVHYTAGGTHTGTSQHRHIDEIQPSGQELQATGVAIYRIRDGKLAEMWNYDNQMDVLVELGQLAPVG